MLSVYINRSVDIQSHHDGAKLCMPSWDGSDRSFRYPVDTRSWKGISTKASFK